MTLGVLKNVLQIYIIGLKYKKVSEYLSTIKRKKGDKRSLAFLPISYHCAYKLFLLFSGEMLILSPKLKVSIKRMSLL